MDQDFKIANYKDINNCIDEYTRLHLTNGNVKAKDRKIKLCVNWSAGSGKTTAVSQWIAKYWDEGIIYSAGTISELNKMFNQITEINPEISDQIKEFHSDCSDWDVIKENPDYLSNYRVILITHQSLATLPPSVITNNYVKGVSELYPEAHLRKWVLSDEKPILFSKIHLNEDQLTILLSIFKKPIREQDADLLEKFMLNIPSGARLLESISKEFSNSNPITRENKNFDLLAPNHINYRKSRLLIELLVPVINELLEKQKLAEENKKSFILNPIEIRYDISKISVNHINFDGTGDLIFKDSSEWKTIQNNKFPYKFKGEFIQIKNSSIDRYQLNVNFKKYLESEDVLIQHVNNISENILQSVKLGNTPLVITWKDCELNLDSVKASSKKEHENIFNLKSLIIKRINALNPELEESKDFFITHWQSGKTRATNEFSNCNEIWLYEGLFLPSSVISDMKSSVMSDSLNSVDILKSELIQALYRTQIRKGEAIKVYYTSNLRNILQDIVENYFKINSSEMFEDENNEQLLDYLKEKIDFEKLDKERKKFIEFVCYGSNVKKVFDFLFLNKEVKLNTTEIAKISGKRHDNLMRELLKVLENINLSYNRIYSENRHTDSFLILFSRKSNHI